MITLEEQALVERDAQSVEMGKMLQRYVTADRVYKRMTKRSERLYKRAERLFSILISTVFVLLIVSWTLFGYDGRLITLCLGTGIFLGAFFIVSDRAIEKKRRAAYKQMTEAAKRYNQLLAMR